ncbi:MAG: hypothetical protein MUO53_00650 [Maribacter sp.]|nr:hypothetical protein [Maribacter sp.]
MKLIPFVLAFLAFFSGTPDIMQLRENYPKANASAEITNAMYNELALVTKSDKTILVAYKGAIATLMAKFAKGIRNKEEFFKSGSELLEYSVETDPQNIEIRCLRLSVQENSPKIVDYKGKIEEDKQFIIDNFKNTPSMEVKEFVKKYVLQSTIFSESERQLF